jgi:hypothetical protein
MPDRLLDRQVRLLEHLTSAAGIFGAGRSALTGHGPQGIHGGLLHVEARFSHEKRMAKIEWVLTRTLDLLGSDRARIIRDFVEACPPVSISWLDNARQFHGFLSNRWLSQTPEPPYLPDVAAYELAYAAVRAGVRPEVAAMDNASETPSGAIRRHPNVALLRCAYDIRSILEGSVGGAVPMRRDTWIAVAMPPATDEPLVSELSGELFELLEMLDEFTNPAIFQDVPGVDGLVADLAARTLLERRP